MRSFYRFALARGMVQRDPAHGVTGPKKAKVLPQFVKEKEMDQLLDEMHWQEDDYKDVRARTIIITFYTTGIRLSELTGLDDAMVDFENCQLKVTGKRNKQRIIPFGEELKESLRRYMDIRDNTFGVRQTTALFVNNKGKRMTSPQVRDIVKARLAQVSTLKKRSPHVLRHTFATTMLNHDAGLESVKKLLGHESLTTTEIYTHTTFEQLKRVYEKAHPRA